MTISISIINIIFIGIHPHYYNPQPHLPYYILLILRKKK